MIDVLLHVNDISKSYAGEPVLSNISMKIEAGERIGIVGANGAGKSTLLQIIAGDIPYEGGAVYLRKEINIGYLRQNSGLQMENTIWDEMLSVFSNLIQVEKELREIEKEMGEPSLLDNPKEYNKVLNRYAAKSDWFMRHGGYEIESKVRSILHGMGFENVPRETIIKNISGGQKTRLALAKILLEEPDLLMLDEPTNHLDFATLSWLENYLSSYSGAIIVVSHDRYFLDALVTGIYEIERTVAQRYTGNYSKYVESQRKKS